MGRGSEEDERGFGAILRKWGGGVGVKKCGKI